MRNISFTLTTEAIKSRSKTVTRRLGWKNVRVGELLQGVERCQGLKKGEKVSRLAVIKVVSVRNEPLKRMNDDIDYGLVECAKEGFGEHSTLRFPSAFVTFFCSGHKRCTPDTEVTRIEFEYL